jgi:hypothetical protein
MTTTRTGEDRIVWFAWLIQQPLFQYGNNIRSQRSASHLSAFAEATNVGACAERHILTPECGQFAISQTPFEPLQEAAFGRRCRSTYVRRPYQSGGLAFGQKLNRAVLAAFGWDCKHALTLQKQRRLADREEPEEGMHYHAVPDNMRRLAGFLKEVGRAWRHALLRRSQRRRLPWSRFTKLLRKYLPPCRLIHPHPTERFRVNTFGKSRMQ